MHQKIETKKIMSVSFEVTWPHYVAYLWHPVIIFEEIFLFFAFYFAMSYIYMHFIHHHTTNRRSNLAHCIVRYRIAWNVLCMLHILANVASHTGIPFSTFVYCILIQVNNKISMCVMLRFNHWRQRFSVSHCLAHTVCCVNVLNGQSVTEWWRVFMTLYIG